MASVPRVEFDFTETLSLGNPELEGVAVTDELTLRDVIVVPLSVCVEDVVRLEVEDALCVRVVEKWEAVGVVVADEF